MLDSIYQITLKSNFWLEKVKIWLLCKEHCYGCHYIHYKICKPLMVYRFKYQECSCFIKFVKRVGEKR